jgi:hypothetical protein
VNKRIAPVVTLASATDGQAVLDRWLAGDRAAPRAVLTDSRQTLAVPPQIAFARLSTGCPCCAGQVPFRVALIRLLRAHRPRSLLLLLDDDQHLVRVRALLADGTLGVNLRSD